MLLTLGIITRQRDFLFNGGIYIFFIVNFYVYLSLII